MMNRTKYTAQKSISRKEMSSINGGCHPGVSLGNATPSGLVIICPPPGLPNAAGASLSLGNAAFSGTGGGTCGGTPSSFDLAGASQKNTRNYNRAS
jgi:hypothetical protein